MKPARMITFVSVAVLLCASLSAPAMAKSKPSKVNLDKFQSCLLAKDGSTDTWRIGDAATCCSNSLGYCVICPTDTTQKCEVARFSRLQVISRLKSVGPTATTLAPVERQRSPVRPRLQMGTMLK